MADVGLIGIGLVGSALTERFIRGGLSVVGYDRRPERVEALTALGGRGAGSARDAVQSAPFVVLSLPDSDEVESVVREVEPVLVGRTVVDTTTGDPDRTAALGARLKTAGVDYVDATIAGSSREVRNGEVIVIAGGEPAVFGRCEPFFRLFASRWFHVGPWGSGARMKLVTNLVLGLNRAVLAEGLSFASACGLDPTSVLEILRAGSTYSRVMDTKGANMIAGDFTAEARLSQHLKDVRLIRELARRHGASVPLSEIHEQLLDQAVALGLGDADNSAVLGVYSAAVARDSVAGDPPRSGGLQT